MNTVEHVESNGAGAAGTTCFRKIDTCCHCFQIFEKKTKISGDCAGCPGCVEGFLNFCCRNQKNQKYSTLAGFFDHPINPASIDYFCFFWLRQQKFKKTFNTPGASHVIAPKPKTKMFTFFRARKVLAHKSASTSHT
jgi:hypothetical protein